MTSGERIKAAISHKTIDRIPMIEIGFWDETIKRFQEEGMPEDFYFQPSIWSGGGYRTEHTVEDYLGLDKITVLTYDCSIQLDTEVYEENENFIIYRNKDGVTCKSFKNKTSVPHFVDNLIKNGKDWNNYKEKYKEKVSFIGNINADVLASDKDSIYQEVKSKVQIAKENGGYIFHSDHSVPPTVSLENYLCAVETTTKFGRYSHQLD